jgi:dipeptidyl aminopeptidase/acylaminoacyl peptidase
LYLSDGNTVEGYIAAPKDYLEQTKPYPVLIYNRGGNGDYGAVNSNFPPSIAISLNAIIVASQYRETNQGTGKDEFGGG